MLSSTVLHQNAQLLTCAGAWLAVTACSGSSPAQAWVLIFSADLRSCSKVGTARYHTLSCLHRPALRSRMRMSIGCT